MYYRYSSGTKSPSQLRQQCWAIIIIIVAEEEEHVTVKISKQPKSPMCRPTNSKIKFTHIINI